MLIVIHYSVIRTWLATLGMLHCNATPKGLRLLLQQVGCMVCASYLVEGALPDIECTVVHVVYSCKGRKSQLLRVDRPTQLMGCTAACHVSVSA